MVKRPSKLGSSAGQNHPLLDQERPVEVALMGAALEVDVLAGVVVGEATVK